MASTEHDIVDAFPAVIHHFKAAVARISAPGPGAVGLEPTAVAGQYLGVTALFALQLPDPSIIVAIVGLICVVGMVFERKRSERSLKESEARFRLLAENSTDVISKSTLDGVYLYVSPSIHTLLGYDPREFIGQKADDLNVLIHPDDLPIVTAARCALRTEPGPRTIAHRIRRKDGEYIWLESIIRLVPNPEAGGEPQVHNTSRDVTERVRIAEALRLAHDELEERVRERTSELVVANAALESQAKELARSNAELEQFAYVASHDLQEPLRMVASYTQLLARRYKDKLDGDAHEFIAFAVDGATRMQELINDLLAYSRVGTQGKAFAPTDRRRRGGARIDNLRATIEESGAEVTCDPLPTVMADGGQLVQLFQNLSATRSSSAARSRRGSTSRRRGRRATGTSPSATTASASTRSTPSGSS